MRIVILTAGSRGDIQPYLALGKGLASAGHTVRLATHASYEVLVHAQGLDFSPIEGDPRDILDSPAGQEFVSSGRNPLRFMRGLAELMEQKMLPALHEAWEICQGAETILFSIMTFFGYHIGEKLGMPSFAAYLQPVSRTRSFATMSAPQSSLGGYNYLTYMAAEQLFWQPMRTLINHWRQESLKLPPAPFLGYFNYLNRIHFPILYGYSPTVIPKPADWGDWLHVTGYWFLDRDAGWQPSPELADFLSSGPAPVYIGFGSIKGSTPEQTTELVLKALKACGRRGVLLSGWGGLVQSDLPEDVFMVDSVPHDWLFPQMAAVVHHGGAGTTAAGLRAGAPTIILPFFADQHFWGEQVALLGAGLRPLPQKRLTAEKLAAAIRTVTQDEGIRRRAAEIGGRIRTEDGVSRAAEALQRTVEAQRL